MSDFINYLEQSDCYQKDPCRPNSYLRVAPDKLQYVGAPKQEEPLAMPAMNFGGQEDIASNKNDSDTEDALDLPCLKF